MVGADARIGVGCKKRLACRFCNVVKKSVARMGNINRNTAVLKFFYSLLSERRKTDSAAFRSAAYTVFAVPCKRCGFYAAFGKKIYSV